MWHYRWPWCPCWAFSFFSQRSDTGSQSSMKEGVRNLTVSHKHGELSFPFLVFVPKRQNCFLRVLKFWRFFFRKCSQTSLKLQITAMLKLQAFREDSPKRQIRPCPEMPCVGLSTKYCPQKNWKPCWTHAMRYITLVGWWLMRLSDVTVRLIVLSLHK